MVILVIFVTIRAKWVFHLAVFVRRCGVGTSWRVSECQKVLSLRIRAESVLRAFGDLLVVTTKCLNVFLLCSINILFILQFCLVKPVLGGASGLALKAGNAVESRVSSNQEFSWAHIE